MSGTAARPLSRARARPTGLGETVPALAEFSPMPGSPRSHDDGSGLRVRRSCLTVPAVRERFIEKAAESSADEVILDLEDSVPEAQKNEETRLRLADAIRSRSWRPLVAVRVGAPSGPHCLPDLETIVPVCRERLDCVVLPKVERADDVRLVERVLQALERAHSLEREIGIEAQIETAGGLLRAAEIAAASPRLESLVFGPGDFAASMGAPTLTIGGEAGAEREALVLFALCSILTAARAAGVQAVDGPFGIIDDDEGLARSARRSAALGYDGKWAIHPRQVEPINRAFTPTEEDLRRAEGIIAAYQQAAGAGRGAVRLEGELVDEASVRMARSVLGRAARL
jgi:citrate lyase subunit beta/citryl-CoA lyase